MLEKIKSTATFLKTKTSVRPKTAVVLGSGLGNFASSIELSETFKYEDIPHFPTSTVEGHAGNLIFGKLHGKEIALLQGRFHFYEGYSMQEVVFPIRVLRQMGVEQLILTNAAGGLNPAQSVGDLMLITDHINLMGDNPLLGKNIDALGPRFPDMHNTYTPGLLELARKIETPATVHQGVYVGVSGPTFETPAEYKFLRIIGGDAVGMSTVPEAIAARHMGMDVFGVSVITDLGVEGKIGEVSHAEVQAEAEKAGKHLTRFLQELIRLQ